MARDFIGSHVALIGVEDLQKALRKFPQTVNRRILNNGARAGARVIQKQARANVPKRSGRLAKGIVVRTARRIRGSHTVGARIVTLADVFYGLILEFGGKNIAARPWLRPAADTTRGQVLGAVRDAVGQRVLKEAAKLAGPFKASGLAKRRAWRSRRR